MDLVLETRQAFAQYESQPMDPEPRESDRQRGYQFAASFNFQGDLLDYAMDGGITVTPRRRRIQENGHMGEYSVVLNRQPLNDVVVSAQDIRLINADGDHVQQLQLLSTQCTFTRSNWNREQLIRVRAVDDVLAEGMHYAVVTHSSTSADPNFDGENVPFLYGRNITMQIEDNDVAGISLSRTHAFVGEGGFNDSYEVVLMTKPWHPVVVTVLTLYPKQTRTTPTRLVFDPNAWNIPQTVIISAVDDTVSEVEYGGLHYGGQVLHYSESKDIRYHTRRPLCYDVPRCDPHVGGIDCIDSESIDSLVRVCDLTNECSGTVSSGACRFNVLLYENGSIPARFGAAPLDPNGTAVDQAPLTYAELETILAVQKGDRNLSQSSNLTDRFEFVEPPAELRGFVLSFLGLLNLEQVQRLRTTFNGTLRAVCDGLTRLETQRWAFEEWPEEYPERVLGAVLDMFGGMITERNLWNCGRSSFGADTSSIDVSVWDNDPGVTLSTASLQVSESMATAATYSIVLNAPPAGINSPILMQQSRCESVNADLNVCGFWSNFTSIASDLYDKASLATMNVSIAIISDAQVLIEPSFVTFDATNWFVPQWISVTAVDDTVAELETNVTIAHRVQNTSTTNYNDDSTSFWFSSTFEPSTVAFPVWKSVENADHVPYNSIPTLLYAPSHRKINVNVQDDDVAGVNVVVQPNATITTQESADLMDWIGDYATANAFDDVSLSGSASNSSFVGHGVGSALKSILIFAPNASSYMKFHLPLIHSGDSDGVFSKATLRLHQTPFKIYNASSNSTDASSDTSDTSDSATFEKLYRVRLTLVDNAWTTTSISTGSSLPQPLDYLLDAQTEATVVIEQSRVVEVDLTPLLAAILPTRLSVMSLRIEVLDDDTVVGMTHSTTQICSSLFERTLRPSLLVAYEFPNLLLHGDAIQSSLNGSSVATLATNGDRNATNVATTDQEANPWWQVCLSSLRRIGTIALFMPSTMLGAELVMVATSSDLSLSMLLTMEDAMAVSCADTCPHNDRRIVRRGILLWDLQAGMRCLRIYRMDAGSLQLVQVEAYASFVSVTLTSDGQGLRSRSKIDWTSDKESHSWRLQETTKHSEDENLALGMPTRQSSTSPSAARSSLAVDGQRRSLWDPLVVLFNSTGDSQAQAPGSTRTELETDPWWEVDLGEVEPIRSIILHPFTGQAGHSYCGNSSTSKAFPIWTGDLYSYSHTDDLLMLPDPFAQDFEVLLSNTSLADGASGVISNTLSFSCANGVRSIKWSSVFTAAQFVTVRKQGLGVLMLNEVEVFRWNPATYSRYLLLDLYGTGEQPLALSSVQIFPPSDVTSTTASLGYALPIAYSIHSVSSQLKSTGAGSASAIQSVLSSSGCYIASSASYHEWLVLEFETPTRIGLLEIDTDVTRCGASLASISELSVASHGATRNGLRSDAAAMALAVVASAGHCLVNATGNYVYPNDIASCAAFLCSDSACNSQSVATGTTSTLVFSDFSDIVLLGKIDFLPLTRLPLSENEHRALLLRDNPVMLWPFDDQPKVLIANAITGALLGRATSTRSLASTSSQSTLLIDYTKEQTFLSNAVALQLYMTAFSLEFWLVFAEHPSTFGSFAVATMYSAASSAVFGQIEVTSDSLLTFIFGDDSASSICAASIATSSLDPAAQRWYHVAAVFDPSSAIVSLSVRFVDDDAQVQMQSSEATCSLSVLSATDKTISFGATPSSIPISKSGFVGQITNAAWYAHALSTPELLDHYHDFSTGITEQVTLSQNAYMLRLTSRPLTPVQIDMDAEIACYRFNLCNTTATPASVVFTPEQWMEYKVVHVVATNDALYEGTHSATLAHTSLGTPAYEVTAFVETLDIYNSEASSSNRLLDEYEALVHDFYRDSILCLTLENATELALRRQVLAEAHANWSTQISIESLQVNDAYSDSLPIASLPITVIDVTEPGIIFSTTSLVVSEDGNVNDFQIMLLTEPTSVVIVHVTSDDTCYRQCFSAPVCPSQALAASSTESDPLYCGDDHEDTYVFKLCNITIHPHALYFGASNWSQPQTVHVAAIDDYLDEADLHVTTISSTVTSLDPTYNAYYLQDIVVAIEDNDDSEVIYSRKFVPLAENISPLGYRTNDSYSLRLATEPWTNVTIALSNEANHMCYRACGYPFDADHCGLPRQQSVSIVRLGSDSPRELQEITLQIPRVMEVQRIATYADHVDQLFSVRIAGGYVREVQTLEFQFSDTFKLRFKSTANIMSAVTYTRTFRIGASDRTTRTPSLDGFVSAESLQSALNVMLGLSNAVNVTRTILYDQSKLSWGITFLRLVYENGSFPLLSVVADSPFEGTLQLQRSTAVIAPSGTVAFRYGATNASVVGFALQSSARVAQLAMLALDGVYDAAVVRGMLNNTYGLEYNITFASVDTYFTLQFENSSSSNATAALGASSSLAVRVHELQPPTRIGGTFSIRYSSRFFNASLNVNQTNPIACNATADAVATEISRLNGIGNVSVSSHQLSPEGGMAWVVQFTNNNGNLKLLDVQSANLTGAGVQIQVSTVQDGESIGGSFVAQMGGLYNKMVAPTQRVYPVDMPLRNTSAIAFNATAQQLQQSLFDLQITEMTQVVRSDVDCDAFQVCNGYVWTVNYTNSAGDLPQLVVFNPGSLTGKNVSISSATVANGTYLTGKFNLTLELWDQVDKVFRRGTTWHLPVNVSAVGMDEALEALSFVRSNREAEFDPETKLWRGMKFDKGVRVYRDGPYLDGGHTWRLEWAIADNVRFEGLKITIHTDLVTQEIEPLQVPSQYDTKGAPRCAAIPKARFQADPTDSFGLRGFCVYDLVNTTIQERFLCNFTIEDPWLVFTPQNWCLPQLVSLRSVNDFIDEATIQNANITYSNVTHTAYGDDLIYVNLTLDDVRVAVESDDVASVLVSENFLKVSEDGVLTAAYYLQLQTEPLYDVTIMVFPWLDSAQTGCYRYELCNLTIPVDQYLFTPQDWNVPQRVVVLATDDSLDEYDLHSTGISHISYSDDLKYHEILISSINVTVHDNDDSGLQVSRTIANVTEGGPNDTYTLRLATEPFAKVTVVVTNIGTVGNYATATPNRIVFTWRDWNITQTVTVAAVDDWTQDSLNSSSVLAHSIKTNDLIYAKLRPLGSVTVFIQDNDVSGIVLSTNAMNVTESNTTIYQYTARLTSEPWFPVQLIPNAAHRCYTRVLSGQVLCNATVRTSLLYFGALNWSVPQQISLIAVDDWLVEAPVHKTLISHSTTSRDPLYQVANYSKTGGNLVLSITDNDLAYVNISLTRKGEIATRRQLHVAEGGFNDSYSIVLNAEPYQNVYIAATPAIETIVDLDNLTAVIRAPQIGLVFNARSTVTLVSSIVSPIPLVFTSLNWNIPRVIQVFGIDDKITENTTQFTNVLHSISSADPGYNISNSSIGVSAVSVMVNDREAIAPPVPTSAVFDGTGAKILVTFDSIVYHAATMLVRSAASVSTIDLSSLYTMRFKSFSCSLVFNFTIVAYSLGTSANYCMWLDLQHLQINLGTQATVTVGDMLTLNECASFTDQICTASNVVRARSTSRAYTQASLAISLPSDIVTPKIVLIAPEFVGGCGTWLIDSSLSSGSGGRAFTQAQWFALPTSIVANASTLVAPASALTTSEAIYSALQSLCSKYAMDWQIGSSSSVLIPQSEVVSLSTALLSMTTMAQLRSACYLRSLAQNATVSASTQVQVDNTRIEVGTRYLVGLALANAFTQRTIATKQIQVNSLPGPSVFIVGDTYMQITRVGDSIALQADSSVSCTERIGTDVGYRWFASSSLSTSRVTWSNVNLNATNTAKDPRVFHVPRALLEAGRTYRFTIEAYMKTVSAAATSTATVTVVVNAGALSAVLNGGDRTVGDKDFLTLNGSASVDPDNSIDPFTFSWACTDITNSSAIASCVNSTASINANSPILLDLAVPSTNSTLTIAPFTLQLKRKLNFTLTVAKQSSSLLRQAVVSTTIWTISGSSPQIQLTPSASKIVSSSRLVLTTQISSAYPYTTWWSQDQGDLSLPDGSKANASNSSDAFSLPLTTATNGIAKNKLTPGLTYVFRLTATDIVGNIGFGVVSVVVNAPPSSGQVAVVPEAGYAMQDTFTLTCSQWTDATEDLPLKYAFGVISTALYVNITSTASSNENLLATVRKQMRPLVAEQLSPTAIMTMLPPSNGQSSENLSIVAFISDNMGSTAVASTSIFVEMPASASLAPVAFVNNLLAANGSVASLDASQRASYLVAASMVLQNAFDLNRASTSCMDGTSATEACSSRGVCDAASLQCVCGDGYLGSNCEYGVEAVRAVNTAILSNLQDSAQVTEPTPSGLFQQALVMDNVIQAAPTAFDQASLSLVTSMSSDVALNAITLQDASSFLDSTGSTIMATLSSVLSISSSTPSSTSSSGSSASGSNGTRRLTSSSSCAPLESAQTKANLQNVLQTLLSLAAVASQDLIAGEDAAVLKTAQVQMFAASGSYLQTSTSTLAVNLTADAIACLDANVFLSAFVFKNSSHSICTLNGSIPISGAIVFTAHSSAALSAAAVGTSTSGIVLQKLSSSSSCVRARASTTTNISTLWQPLAVVTIPHNRLLTSVEKAHFSTVCRVWNSDSAAWDADICFKDDTLSTNTSTVCYCNQIGSLEVMVALQETLDYVAMIKNLYRDDPISIIPSATLLIVFVVFMLSSSVGKRQDAIDARKEKDRTIKNLNRSKWGELEARTQSVISFADFNEFAATVVTAKYGVTTTGEATLTTPRDNSLSLAQAHTQTQAFAVNAALASGNVLLPNEARTLFGSSAHLDRQYTRLTGIFRACNGLLVLLGLILLFVGVDFHFVLGNSTSELLIYVYGDVMGIVMMAFGIVLMLTGALGYALARQEISHIARHSYLLFVCALVIVQIVFVAMAFRSLEDFSFMPSQVQSVLQREWTVLPSHVQNEIQSTYGCCGFASIQEQAACPEEALEANPPRTCFLILADHAQQLFNGSFLYLEIILLVEIACVAVVNVLIKWRNIRLQQLVGEPASSSMGETSVERTILSSQWNIVLLCSLPSVCYVFASVMIVGVIYGADLIAEWNFVSNAVVSALFGVELGALWIVTCSLYLAILLKGIRALELRDVRGMQWFLALSLSLLLICTGILVYFTNLHSDFLVDPAIEATIGSKFVRLPRNSLVQLETSMGCCGFDSIAQGACVVRSSSSIPTCRAVLLDIVVDEHRVFNRRLWNFQCAQATVLALFAVCLYRLRRFVGKVLVRPLALGLDPFDQIDEYQSPMDVVIHNASFFVLVLLNLVLAVVGLIVIGAGLDAIFQVNVLHVSYLLKAFDRHLGVYLVFMGGVLELFVCNGLLAAWKRSRALFATYALTGFALFTVVFGALGYSYRMSRVTTFNASAMDNRLEALWIAASSNTKHFVQNIAVCCGYNKIQTQNGTSSFTDTAQTMSWTQSTDTTTAYVVSPDSSSESTARSLTSLVTRVLSEPICPPAAQSGCADSMKRSLASVASYSFVACIAVLTLLLAVLVASSILCLRQGKKAPWKSSWRLILARGALLVLAFGSLLTALTTLFIGLDVVVQWELFSSTLLQMLFAKSIGIALVAVECVCVLLNVYSLQGAVSQSVHMLFLQAIGHAFVALALWSSVSLMAYVTQGVDWPSHLNSFLDHKWDTLSFALQHRVSLEYSCCGFNDPVAVKGKGIVFDRAAVGYSCSLANARGCSHALTTQIHSSLAWLFAYLLALALIELLLCGVSSLAIQQLARVKPHDWFAIESRLHYASGKFRSEMNRNHVLVSLRTQYDAKFTRRQRLMCVLCSMVTTLAIYTGYFATQGCTRHALKTCEQPSGWAILGMGLLYGGISGYASLMLARWLFFCVRNRSEQESKEIAVARQRKEKVLLFRDLFTLRRADAPDKIGNASSSSMEAAQATTEERWYTWIMRFADVLFHILAVVLFLVGLGLVTLMCMVLLGYKDTLYGVQVDHGPTELLITSLLLSGVSLLAWLAVDLRDCKRNYASSVVFVGVAIASVLLMICFMVGVYIAHQVLQDTGTSSSLSSSNWAIRKTGFDVIERLETVWIANGSSLFRNSVQQDLRCCGFRDATDNAYRPCPFGLTVQVDYQAQSVNGTVITKTLQEEQDLAGCFPKMLAAFQALADKITFLALGICFLLFALCVCGVFLAYDLVISKDAKLKLRVATKDNTDVRETFEKVVGLKIAAPARGKLRSQMISTSLESVVPTIASELASSPLSRPGTPSAREGISSSGQSTSTGLSQPLAHHARLNAQREAAARAVPYPASIVYVVYAICSGWIIAVGYLIIHSSMSLGKDTAWLCILSWAVGVLMQWLVVEPSALFLRIIWATVDPWWQTTWLVRVIRYGRNALRIKPDAATAEAMYYASLSLYERIRYNASVRIQRRLLTCVTRRRYLRRIREMRQEAHRALAERRRASLKQAIAGFTSEEVTAFGLLFRDADTAQLGLVPHAVISQSIYQLGVHVTSEAVRDMLTAFDPAYADLVDFEHFLYGMHCVRVHHQEEQLRIAELAAQAAAQDKADVAKRLVTEEFVSSSSRFGPAADPQAKVLVKRQNLLRELKEKRESLSHKLLGKLPPILQRSKTSSSATPTLGPVSSRALLPDQGDELVTPTESVVFLQNRKLSPKKRALEMVLKRKRREEKTKAAAATIAVAKPSLSPRQKAKALVQHFSPRGRAVAAPVHEELGVGISPIPEEDTEVYTVKTGQKTDQAVMKDSTRTPLASTATVKAPAVALQPEQLQLVEDAVVDELAAIDADPIGLEEKRRVNDLQDAEQAQAESTPQQEQLSISTQPEAIASLAPIQARIDTEVAIENAVEPSIEANEIAVADSNDAAEEQEEGEAEAGLASPEPKPFGTYMLLKNKQSADQGKNKVLEKILQRQAQAARPPTPTSLKYQDKDSASSATKESSSRPPTPEKKPVTAVNSSSSLAKALKKKQTTATKTGATSSKHS